MKETKTTVIESFCAKRNILIESKKSVYILITILNGWSKELKYLRTGIIGEKNAGN